MSKNESGVGKVKAPAPFQKLKKMADLTKAELQAKLDEMNSVEGVLDTILAMSQEDIQKLARTIKTTQKGMKVHNAILFGVKLN